MTLENYLNDKKIENVGSVPENAKRKLAKAFKFFKNIKLMIGVADLEVIYPLAHDSVRMACEAILFMSGYRVKKNIDSSHYVTIDCAKELAGDSLRLEFIRFQQMRKQRNKLEYGDLDNISQSELEQAIKDLEKLLGYARVEVEKEKNKGRLI